MILNKLDKPTHPASRLTSDDTWWKEAVIYQIYPRSYKDGNGDGIGDIPGMIEKLDYLVDLGVDALWLSPVYPSPDVDFGYDISDYRSIDPKYGSMEDFDRLIDAAHKRNLRVILDLVLNHTSDQHAWFLESKSSRHNRYRDWYLWREPAPGGKPPNNWQSHFGGSGWQWDAATGQYYFHLFTAQQPDLNWRNPAVKAEMLDIFRFWCERGVDGFRLDVFNAYFKDAAFTDNPPRPGIRPFDRQVHLNDINQPELLPFLHEMRALLDQCTGRYAVGETFLDDRDWPEPFCGDHLLHATFNFELLKAGWNPKRMMKAITGWEETLADTAWPTQVLNNHDNPRTATRYHARQDDKRLKLAAALLLTLRGTPFLYYGEEIGMRDIPLKRQEILDPPGRRYWPFYRGRDGCRSPMQWDSTPQAGFSSSTPWLPVNIVYAQRNVQQQLPDTASLLNFYRALIALRRAHPALHCGSFTPLEATTDLLAYKRQAVDETIIVLLNFARRISKLTLRPEDTVGKWKVLLSSAPQKYAFLNPTMALQPGQVLILQETDLAQADLAQV